MHASVVTLGAVLALVAVSTLSCRDQSQDPANAVPCVPVSIGCNAVFIAEGGEARLGRNLDVPFPDGYWVVNPRGVGKVAYMPSGLDQTPAAWRAKYGSLTLNAFHVDIPLGGMDETGLVVEHLACRSKYPGADDRPGVVPFQLAQYLLDTCATVEEALEREESVRLVGWVFEIMHFMVCDPAGSMAVIEYVPDGDGRCDRRVYEGERIPDDMTCLGNASYAQHVESMRQYRGFGGDRAVATDRGALAGNTLNQFAYSAARIQQYRLVPHRRPDGLPVRHAGRLHVGRHPRERGLRLGCMRGALRDQRQPDTPDDSAPRA